MSILATQPVSMHSAQTIASNVEDTNSIPDMAFGKADWERFFGDIGEEPPLPENIEKILNKPCPFWPNKTVKETHLLTLIPNTFNGKRFTLTYLEQIIQNSKSGHATKYVFHSKDLIKNLVEKDCTAHWVLMTRDVIPGSRKKSFARHSKILADYNQRTGLTYSPPHEIEAVVSILMHYVKKGEALYTLAGIGGNKKETYTTCQEELKGWRVIVGGFFGAEGFCRRFISSTKSSRDGVAGVIRL